MPAWPGGPCPGCGVEMPPRIVHCQHCRRLLNVDLRESEFTRPEFAPLAEIDARESSGIATAERAAVATSLPSRPATEIEPRGVFDDCPACGRELRISRKYAGQMVRCKHCGAGFTSPSSPGPVPGRSAYYADCPHCRQELRIAAKYYGTTVACKFCSGPIRFGGVEAD